MDLLYAMRDLGVADPAADSTGEATVRAALCQEVDKATVARRPGRARRTRPRLLAGATGVVAVSATAVTLLVSATASPPAFAVTRHHDGSVSVKINRRSGVAGANHKLAALGIHERVKAVDAGQSNPQGCVVLAPGRQMSDLATGYLVNTSGTVLQVQNGTVQDGTDSWQLLACSTGNTGSGNTGPG